MTVHEAGTLAIDCASLRALIYALRDAMQTYLLHAQLAVLSTKERARA